MTVSLVGGGLEFDVPAGWEVAAQVPDGVAMVVCGPGEFGSFRPSLVVTVDDVTGVGGLRDWQQGADYLMADYLGEYLLVDLERVLVAGGVGVRRLAHHVVDGGVSVTLEQWAFVHGSQGVTLSATTATVDYPGFAPVLGAVVGSLRVRLV